MDAPIAPVVDPISLWRVMPRLLSGLLLCGVGIAMMVRAELGLGPWDVLHQGLADHFRISMGATTVAVGVVVLSLWVPLKERPGLGSVADVAVVGIVVDAALALSTPPGTTLGRWAWVLIGPLVFGVGAAIYIGCGVGSGPRDGLMTGLARRGVSIAVGRTAIEVIVLALGWALGGTVGFGTVYFALIVGPVVHVVLPVVRAPWFPPGAPPRVLGRTSVSPP